MKILHLVAIPQLTGAAEPVLDMVRALRALGADVDLRIDTKREGNLQAILQSEGAWIPDDLVLSTKGTATEALLDLGRLRELIRGYDLVHTHLSHDHTLAAIARLAEPGPPIVRTLHAERVLQPGWARSWLYADTDAFTVASAEEKRRFAENFPDVEAEVVVLPGAIDAQRFRPNPEARARVRATLGLTDERVIGCVARFQAGRRHDVMLDALAMARSHAPKLRLALIGHGELEDAIRTRAAASDVAGAVLFPGYRRHDLPDYLAALDAALWLVPGNDATSRAVLQAMATGLPVIGGHQGAIVDQLEHGQSGILVDPDEPAEVARAMVQLANLDRMRVELGARARLRAVQHYSHEQRGRTLSNLYVQVVEAHHRSRP